jgi:hypothetical protein
MCIAVRRTLIRAAKRLRDEGVAPANVDNTALDIVRPVTVVLPEGADWVAETADLRDGTSGAKPAHEIKPLSYLDIKAPRKEQEIEALAGGGGGGS